MNGGKQNFNEVPPFIKINNCYKLKIKPMIPNIDKKDEIFDKQNKLSLSVSLDYLGNEIESAIRFGYGSVKWYITPNNPVLQWILDDLKLKGYEYKLSDQFLRSEKEIIVSWTKFQGKLYKPNYYNN